MAKTAREDILTKLKAAPVSAPGPRPHMPPLHEMSWDREQMVDHFIHHFTTQTGVAARVKGKAAVVETLASICREEGIEILIKSTDPVVNDLDLLPWAEEAGLTLLDAGQFKGREAYKQAVFTQAQAGLTGADFAVAESGTIGLIHHRNQPRLVSVAPVRHIVLIPESCMVPTYEDVTDRVFKDRAQLPSQFTFTTGPSMTGDIQGGQFKGMHGPQKIFAILYDLQKT